ncbi:MAG: hypothetical protein V1918_01895 [Planctomycetota bacterium]
MLHVFFLVAGLCLGWCGEAFREKGWVFRPPRMRYHPVMLLEVKDGVTLKVLWQGRVEVVRLKGLAPPEKDSDAFPKAAENLRALLKDASAVTLEFDKTGRVERDKEGRLLCTVWHGEKNLGLEQEGSGYCLFDRG